MELQHDQRNVRFYPREFNSWDNNMTAKSKYYSIDPANGEIYLDINKVGADLDLISPDCGDCKNCKGCKEKFDQALHAGGADPYTEAISRGLQGAGQLAQAFKANPDTSLMRSKLKQAKASCPKKPFLRITKKQKAQAQAAADCIAKATKDQQDFELAVINANKAFPEYATRERDAVPQEGTSTGMIIGIASSVLILLVIIVIIFIRMRKPKKKGT